MEMFDLGSKNNGPVAIEASKDKVYYPSLHIDKAPDFLKNKEVGNACRFEVVGKIVSKSVDEAEDGERARITLEIHKIGYLGSAGGLSKDEYLKKNPAEREEYDRKRLSEEGEEDKEEDGD